MCIRDSAYTKAWTKDGDLDAVYPRITNSDSNNNMRGSSFYGTYFSALFVKANSERMLFIVARSSPVKFSESLFNSSC